MDEPVESVASEQVCRTTVTRTHVARKSSTPFPPRSDVYSRSARLARAMVSRNGPGGPRSGELRPSRPVNRPSFPPAFRTAIPNLRGRIRDHSSGPPLHPVRYVRDHHARDASAHERCAGAQPPGRTWDPELAAAHRRYQRAPGEVPAPSTAQIFDVAAALILDPAQMTLETAPGRRRLRPDLLVTRDDRKRRGPNARPPGLLRVSPDPCIGERPRVVPHQRVEGIEVGPTRGCVGRSGREESLVIRLRHRGPD